MKKIICLLLLGSTTAFAQYTAVPSSSYPTLDAILNGKLAFSTGVGAPGGACIQGKDVYTSTVGAVYFCTATNVWTLLPFLASFATVATSGAFSDLSGRPTLPVGAIVGTTDTQTLTNKTVNGAAPSFFAFLDATSSIQTQINSKQASLGFTAENAANKGASSGYAPLNVGGQVPAANLPVPGVDTCDTTGSSVNVYVCTSAQGQATTNGKGFYVRIVTPNTGSSTLTINSVIWTLKKQGANLGSGDLIATGGSQWYHVVSDGVFWNVISRLGTDGAGGGTWGTIGGTLSSQTDLNTALGLKAPLASPALTGVPTVPTATTGTNTTQAASTAFVLANAGSSLPGTSGQLLSSNGSGGETPSTCTTGSGAITCPGSGGSVAGGVTLYDAGPTNYFQWQAPTSITASYIVQPPAATPANGNVMTMGTCSGTPAICPTTWATPSGGGGLTGTPTSHYTAIGAGGSALNFAAPSTATYVLTSNGPSADPTFQAPSGGGGSGSQSVATGAGVIGSTGGVLTSTSDVIVATSSALPALASGGCWDYELFAATNVNAAIGALKVWFGAGQTIGSVYSAGNSLSAPNVSGFNPAGFWVRGNICNNTGVQNTQTALIFPIFNNMSPGSGSSGATSQNAALTTLQIGISVASTSGAEYVYVQSFRVWRTQ